MTRGVASTISDIVSPLGSAPYLTIGGMTIIGKAFLLL